MHRTVETTKRKKKKNYRLRNTTQLIKHGFPGIGNSFSWSWGSLFAFLVCWTFLLAGLTRKLYKSVEEKRKE